MLKHRQAFVPAESKELSINYVRISSWSIFFSATSYALGTSLRAFDRPDVPLAISTTATLAAIILDLLFLSDVRVVQDATVNTQAAIRLACDGAGALAGLLYLAFSVRRKPSIGWRAFVDLAKPGVLYFIESAVRNALYLTWVHTSNRRRKVANQPLFFPSLITGIVALGCVVVCKRPRSTDNQLCSVVRRMPQHGACSTLFAGA